MLQPFTGKGQGFGVGPGMTGERGQVVERRRQLGRRPKGPQQLQPAHEQRLGLLGPPELEDAPAGAGQQAPGAQRLGLGGESLVPEGENFFGMPGGAAGAGGPGGSGAGGAIAVRAGSLVLSRTTIAASAAGGGDGGTGGAGGTGGTGGISIWSIAGNGQGGGLGGRGDPAAARDPFALGWRRTTRSGVCP